jgi:hypothetical protein
VWWSNGVAAWAFCLVMTPLISWREAAACGAAGALLLWLVACALAAFPGLA